MEKWMIEFSEKSDFVHSLNIRQEDKYKLVLILTRLYSKEAFKKEIRKVIENSSLKDNEKVKQIEGIFDSWDNPFNL